MRSNVVLQRRLNPNLYMGFKPTRFRRRYGRFQGIPSHITANSLNGIEESESGYLGQIPGLSSTDIMGSVLGNVVQVGGQVWTAKIGASVAKKKIGAEKAIGLAQAAGQTAIGVEAQKTQAIVGTAQSAQLTKTEPYKWIALAVAAAAGVYFLGKQL